MKKTYFCPESIQFNMETEQMIAASLDINQGEADQLSNEASGWSSEDWTMDAEEVEVEE